MKSQKYQQSAEDRTYFKCFHMTMSEFVGTFNYNKCCNFVTFTHLHVIDIYPLLLSLEHTKHLEILVFLVHTIKVSGVQCCLDHNFLQNI